MEKGKKKLIFYMYEDFHAHLIVTKLNSQESNIHGKLKKLLPLIYKKETYMLTTDLE